MVEASRGAIDHDVGAEQADTRQLYLDLLKRILTRTGFENSYRLIARGQGWRRVIYPPIRKILSWQGLELVRRYDAEIRRFGDDLPSDAETMIGMARLENLERCIVDALRRGVPGDLMETGVWRGGAAIFMRAVLKAYGACDRLVWAADSFQGLPRPDTKRYAHDASTDFWKRRPLAVSLDEVKANFARYGLLDEQVHFVVGWFRDTLPTAPVEQLAVLRLDGDMYESTTIALQALYPKLSAGGYVIIDDYAIPVCRQAVDDYRHEMGIADEIHRIDRMGAYWQKTGATSG